MKTVIIGGVAGGAACAARLRRLDESAEIIILEKGGYISYANCGLPYYVGGIVNNRESLLVQTPEGMKSKFNIDVRVHHEVIRINRAEKAVSVIDHTSGREYTESYDKLVISTGSTPVRPGIPGIESEKIHTLWSVPDADALAKIAASSKSIAVIGGGPSGLSCAYYLALMGHKVTVFEEKKKLGGMLRYGIPSYRFPREKLDAEIESILSLGIEAKTGVIFGKDVTFEDIKDEYDCTYIAIGAHQDKKVGIDGEDSKNVMSAVEMLRAIGDDEYPDFSGKKVVVIGGGNVAMDVTRSSVRLGAEKVTCVYRRRVDDMTALPDEITGAMAEGAELMTLMAPVRIEADENGNAVALWVQPQIIGEADKSGRPRPNKADLPEVRIPADIIVVAIGQGIEIAGFEQAGVPIKRGTFVAGLSGQVNDMANVFAGGDCVTGPATAIRAIAAGKVAAANIDVHLGYHHEITVDVDIPTPKLNNRPPHGRINTTEREAGERKNDFNDIECGLTHEGACTEASRCLRCDHFGYGIFRGGREKKW